MGLRSQSCKKLHMRTNLKHRYNNKKKQSTEPLATRTEILIIKNKIRLVVHHQINRDLVQLFLTIQLLYNIIENQKFHEETLIRIKNKIKTLIFVFIASKPKRKELGDIYLALSPLQKEKEELNI